MPKIKAIWLATSRGYFQSLHISLTLARFSPSLVEMKAEAGGLTEFAGPSRRSVLLPTNIRGINVSPQLS